MKQAVIDTCSRNVVAAKKITTDMLDVNTFNGVTLTARSSRLRRPGSDSRCWHAPRVYGTGTTRGGVDHRQPGQRLVKLRPRPHRERPIRHRNLPDLRSYPDAAARRTGDVSHAMYVAAGIATGDFTVRRVFTGQPNSTRFPKRLAIVATRPARATRRPAGTRFYGNRFTWVNPYLADDTLTSSSRHYAGSNGVESRVEGHRHRGGLPAARRQLDR